MIKNEHPLLDTLRRQFLVPGHCGLVREDSTLEEMIALLDTPKGVEHCTKYNLPTYDIILGLQDKAPEHWYIEHGCKIVLHNPDRAILVGSSTDAIIIVDETHEANIVMLHGAKAHIIIRDFAAVRVDRAGDTELTITRESEDAFIYDNHNKQQGRSH